MSDKPAAKKIWISVRLAGAVLIGLGLYGWIGATDPDCRYFTGILLQLRLCFEEHSRAGFAPSWTVPAVCLLLVGLGLALERLGRRFGKKVDR